jgi:hypothetical protein
MKVAEKHAWYKRNTRVNVVFPFLPLDQTGVPLLPLSTWKGPWTEMRRIENVTNSVVKLFGSHGAVEAFVNATLSSVVFRMTHNVM